MCEGCGTTLAHTPELAVQFTVALDMNTNHPVSFGVSSTKNVHGGIDDVFTIWGGSGFNISYNGKEITFSPSLILTVPFFIRTTVFF